MERKRWARKSGGVERILKGWEKGEQRQLHLRKYIPFSLYYSPSLHIFIILNAQALKRRVSVGGSLWVVIDVFWWLWKWGGLYRLFLWFCLLVYNRVF